MPYLTRGNVGPGWYKHQRKVLSFEGQSMNPHTAFPAIDLALGVIPTSRGYRLTGRVNTSSPTVTLTGKQADNSVGTTVAFIGTYPSLGFDNRWVLAYWGSADLEAYNLYFGNYDSQTIASPYFLPTFCQFGDKIIAICNSTGGVGNAYKSTMVGSAVTWTSLMTSTETPDAMFCGVVRNQLVIAHVINTGTPTGTEDMVWWSAVDDASDFDPDETTQCDFQRLLSVPGPITGFVGGEYGIVFKPTGIYRMDYVGAPLIYTFEEISSHLGCASIYSTVQVGHDVYFISAQGPAVIREGRTVELISSYDSLKPFVFDSQFSNELVSIDPVADFVFGYYDAVNHLIFWKEDSHVLCYSISSDKFSILDISEFDGTGTTANFRSLVQMPPTPLRVGSRPGTIEKRTIPYLAAIYDSGLDITFLEFTSNNTQDAQIISGFFKLSEAGSAKIVGARLIMLTDNRKLEAGSSPFEVPYDITIKAGPNPMTDAYTSSEQNSAPTDYDSEDLLPFNIQGDWFRIIVDIPSYNRSTSNVEIINIAGVELWYEEDEGQVTEN